jgi:hypothetical protein
LIHVYSSRVGRDSESLKGNETCTPGCKDEKKMCVPINLMVMAHAAYISRVPPGHIYMSKD